jgi:hypothetical protein
MASEIKANKISAVTALEAIRQEIKTKYPKPE